MARRKRGDGRGPSTMRSLDLESFWLWLPTFRVVAERENLQEASRLLRLSASSVSRTIRLLETELGRQLFSRDGGRLQLNPAGSVLLDAVRRSMRLVHDAASEVSALDVRGPTRLAMPRALLGLLALPTMVRARAADPSATFFLSHEVDVRAVTAGLVDIAVMCSPPAQRAGIEIHRLGAIEVAIHCGREHPLWPPRKVTFGDLAAHAFIVEADGVVDGATWPAEHSRKVAIELADPAHALDCCASSLGLAVLPVASTRDAVQTGRLRALRGPPLPPVSVFAVRRPQLVDDRAQTVIAAMTACLAS